MSVNDIPERLVTDDASIRDDVRSYVNGDEDILSYGPINTWDVSQVTNMRYLFANDDNDDDGPLDFNEPINDWDVSNVINMEGMFFYARDFNQNLN